ncbi:hypothetical protein AB0J21_15720 [Streptomyces sp. NPDC049954]|uniref:hypothetical protein n=1 Tax=Streptomyces sp. NPDC049954 TaxID=3155779 RepID=UPI0034281698
MRARADKAAQGAVSRTAGPVAETDPGPLRTPRGRWLLRGKDGRLTAYALTAEGVSRWTETRPGGPEWSGPDHFPGPHLTDLTVGQGGDGYAHLVGRRSVPRQGAPGTTDLVHAVQYQSGRPLSPFRSLGSPHQEAERQALIGAPAVVVDTAGTVHVLVRNAGRGLMVRWEDKTGKWAAWKDLKGSRLHGAPAAVATGAGPLEVLCAGEGPAGHWVRPRPGVAFERAADIPLSVVPDSLTALETGEGRVTYYWTDPDNGGVVGHRPGGWLLPLGGAPAEGPVSVVRAPLDGYDCTVFAYRDAFGQILLAACGTENEQGGVWWAPTGEESIGQPGLAVDAHGRVVLTTLGADGRLRVARQNSDPGLVLAPSITV